MPLFWSFVWLVATVSAAGQGPPSEAPTVRPDGRVSYRLRAPAARQVTLWGEWMRPESTLPLTRDADGIWSIDVGPLDAGLYLYAFDVDGLRVADPMNRRVTHGYPGLASLVEIPGASAVFMAVRPVPHGTVHVVRYASPATGTLRQAQIYTPPGFDASSRRRYPTAYLLHGSSDNDTGWVEPGRAGIIVDNLLAAGQAVPMVLVMPDGHPFPSFELNTRMQNLELLREDLLRALIPLAERDYRASSRREDRAIVGLSMGGAQALHIGVSAVETFGSIGLFSTPGDIPFSAPFEIAQAANLKNPERLNRLRLFWVACGRDDPLLGEARQVSEVLKRHGVRHTWRETNGSHDWNTWRRYWFEMAPLLFR